MSLDLWLKDMRMPFHQLESPLGSDDKLRLWEVTHACIDKAVTDSLSAEVQSSKDGLTLLHDVFMKVINPELRVYTDRLYQFSNAAVPVPAANSNKL